MHGGSSLSRRRRFARSRVSITDSRFEPEAPSLQAPAPPATLKSAGVARRSNAMQWMMMS
jgi:hypothetical protein